MFLSWNVNVQPDKQLQKLSRAKNNVLHTLMTQSSILKLEYSITLVQAVSPGLSYGFVCLVQTGQEGKGQQSWSEQTAYPEQGAPTVINTVAALRRVVYECVRQMYLRGVIFSSSAVSSNSHKMQLPHITFLYYTECISRVPKSTYLIYSFVLHTLLHCSDHSCCSL